MKAQWFVPAVEDEPDTDPFLVEDAPTVIDVSTDEARIHTMLEETVRREARLDAIGVTCPIKDRAETSCFACPVYRGASEERIAPLCRLGREQETLLTKLAVIRYAEEEE